VPCNFTHFLYALSRLDMQPQVLLFSLFTLFSFAGASVIPLQRVRIPSNIQKSPSGNDVLKQHPRFVMKRRESLIKPSIITLVAGGPTPTPTTTPLDTVSATSTTPTSSSSSTSPPAPTLSNSPTTTDRGPQPSQPPVDTDGSRKYVVAHHMVGNTFPYKLQDWADDITLAHASGIDGFALNMGTDDWQPARVADA